MKLIHKEDFLKYKKSDTLVIWGSGSSIKNLNSEDFDYLNQFDSISTTMFSKSKIQTTFYIIGEILFNYYRAKTKNQKVDNKLLYKLYEESGDSPSDYIKTFKDYPKTCFIIWDDKWTLNKEDFKELDKLDNDYFLVKQYGHEPNLTSSKLKYDEKTGPNNKFIDKSLYNKKLLLDDKIWLHQWKGINAPIYFAKCMDYKKVIFVGVDLTAGPNSYGYDRKKFVEIIASKIHKGHKQCTVHPCKELLFKLVNYLKDDIKFSTFTPSPLDEIIDIHINLKIKKLSKNEKDIIFSKKKSLLEYPILRDRNLNENGLISYRSLLYWNKLISNRKYFINKCEKNIEFFNKNGYILINNFLENLLFNNLIKEIDNIQMNFKITNNTKYSKLFISKILPLLYHLCGTNKDLNTDNSFEKFDRIRYQNITNTENDVQTLWHIDTFHSTIKWWFYLEDVNTDNGCFNYYKTSNIPSQNKLNYLKYKTNEVISNLKNEYTDNKDRTINSWEMLNANGSYRCSCNTEFENEVSKYNYNKELIKKCIGPKNTLLIADTSGFHKRGHIKEGNNRKVIFNGYRIDLFNL